MDGVAIGSSLAPGLANIFMGLHESKWLDEYNLNKPKFYLRHVDDILAAFDNEQDSLNFLNFLNNRHPNIKFTIEKQINHSIAFLDVFISGINNQNLINKVIKKYLDYKFSSNQNQLKDKSDVLYFKLPYIGNLSHHIKNQFLKLRKEVCKKKFNIKLFFNSLKIKNFFSCKDPVPNDLKYFLLYKFTCAS